MNSDIQKLLRLGGTPYSVTASLFTGNGVNGVNGVNAIGTDGAPYTIMGGDTVAKLTNKDLTSPTNKFPLIADTKFTVSPDGNGKYTSIQAAIDAATLTGYRETVFIGHGDYNENIILRDRVNLLGAGPGLELLSTSMRIRGNVTQELSSGMDITINNLVFEPTLFLIGGSAGAYFLFNNVHIHGQVDYGMVINNLNAAVIFVESVINGPTGVVNLISGQVVAFIRSVVGAIFPQPVAPILRAASPTSALTIYCCLGQASFDFANQQVFCLNCFFNGGDQPMFVLDNATVLVSGSTMLTNAATNNFIAVGTGIFGDGGNVLGGRDQLGPGVVAQYITNHINDNGSWAPMTVLDPNMINFNIQAATYTRVGFRVNLRVRCSFEVSIAAGDASMRFSLPVPRTNGANFASVNDATGSAALDDGTEQKLGFAQAFVGSQEIEVKYYLGAGTGPYTVDCNFGYNL